MKKNYHLKVIKPGSYSEEVDVIAYSLEVKEGAYLFYDFDGHLICAYPTNLTIIQSIKKGE